MSAPPPSAIHEPKVIIDGNGNTEVMNNILGFCDRRTLFAWRRVNHRFQYEADSLLAHHVVFTFLMEGEPVEGKPNGSMFGLVDPLGRFLPGSPDTVVIVGKGETLPSLISVRRDGFHQLAHFGRHVQVLDIGNQWELQLYPDGYLNPPTFPRLQAVRIWYTGFPRDGQYFDQSRFRYHRASVECQTAVIFGDHCVSEPFGSLGFDITSGETDVDRPRKLVHHILPDTLDADVFAHAKPYLDSANSVHFGTRTSLAIIFNALKDAGDESRMFDVRNSTVFVNVYLLLERTKTTGCFPTSIVFVGLEEFLAGYGPSDEAPPGIINKMRGIDDLDPTAYVDGGHGDPSALFELALSSFADLMKTGQLTYMSLNDYAATLTEHQKFIELVPSDPNIARFAY